MSILTEYVEAWRAACRDLADLTERLESQDWTRPTDCPGWDVHDIVAHCAAIEAELAGDPRAKIHIDVDLPHIVGPANIYTERGVLHRRALTPQQLRANFLDAVKRRSSRIEEAGPVLPTERPEVTPGGIEWDWQTLMRNRTIDIWVHEQDIRRAVGRPGNLDTVGARITQETFAAALPFIVGKRVAAPAGTTVLVDITGPVVAAYGVLVRDDGRGVPSEAPVSDPTVSLAMSTEVFTLLSAGRRDPGTLEITTRGDVALAGRMLESMSLTI